MNETRMSLVRAANLVANSDNAAYGVWSIKTFSVYAISDKLL